MKKYLYTIGVFFALTTGLYGANSYYDHLTFPATGSAATSASMRAEFDLIEAGFDKLPTLAGANNKLIVVNAGATGLTTSASTLTLGGNLTTTGAFATTLTATGNTTVTLPTTGTLATLAGAESFSTKTLVAPVLSGSVTGTYTLAGIPTISSSVNLTGGNIAFPASQVPSAGVNTLDDYEEGPWTPSVGGTATYVSQSGEYTKIGRLVFVRGTMVINVLGTGSVSVLSGLPFTSANTGFHPCVVSQTSSLAVSPVSITGVVAILGTNVFFPGRTAASTSDGNLNIFGNGATISFSCTYQT